VNLVPGRGRIVAYDASDNVTECIAGAFCTVERYGFQAGSMWRLADLTQLEGRTNWSLIRDGRPWGEFSLGMAGEHNALNASAAAALAAGQGIDVESIRVALETFASVKRRLEVRAVVNGITIIDDFAHHPTAIRETLKALRAMYPAQKLWAILEPRSNTLRRNVFERELVDSLMLADEVVLAQIFKQESIPADERLHPEAVIERLRAAGHVAEMFEDADSIVNAIAARMQTGDVVAILSNGAFGGIYEKLPQRLLAATPVL
jgi:UDP-N-acetylmuramate: L-alanyl-gamma-D-glutamyl-meso-diaminopimelate ligase